MCNKPSRVRVTVMVCLLCCTLWPSPATPQLAVIDVAAVAQLAITVSQLLQLVGLNVRDLSALANIGAVIQLLEQLQQITAQVESFATELDTMAQGWTELANPEAIPCTGVDLDGWNWRASQWGLQGSRLAVRGGSIINQSLIIVQALMSLVGMVQSILGTTSGLQVTSALMSVTVVELQKLQAVQASFQQARLGDTIMAQVNTLATRCLRARRLEGWGTFNPVVQ